MMHRPQSALRRLLALLTVGLALMAIAAASAQASSPIYGELERFSEKGAGLGQLQNPEAALGVDSEDNSVFVVDEIHEYSSFRIQKFSKVGGKYKEVASHEFTPPDASGAEELGTVEGVAVDPAQQRVYVLSIQARAGEPKQKIEPEVETASALYAFNTSTLETAVAGSGSAEKEGVLAGSSVLQTESKEPGTALLEPSGITVDPENHDVIILGYVARKIGPGEFAKAVALDQVTSAGALGSKWVDARTVENKVTKKPEEVSYFGECECANSPIVNSSGNVYVRADVEEEEGEGPLAEIVQIPKSFDSTEPATPAFTQPPVESLAEYVERGHAFGGGALAIGPEGQIYAMARIANANERDTKEQGAIVLNGQLEELGWTGGQSPAFEGGACALQQGKQGQWPVLAAGKEGTLFVLDRESETSNIVVLGPGGHGCPIVEATSPTVEVAGQKGLEQVATDEAVTLESQLVQAHGEPKYAQGDALSVEWNFGDGTTETVQARQGSKSVVQHEFKLAGDLTITETVHTDDLASPEVKTERKLLVVGVPAVVTREGAVSGTKVKLSGTVNPFGAKATCEFEYGTSVSYGSKVACSKSFENEESDPESAEVAGLNPNTTYHFRLVAKSVHGSNSGKDVTFTTGAGPVPALLTEEAVALEQTTATVKATVNPEGVAVTKCEFQYGTSEATLSKSAACAELPGSGSVAVAAEAKLSELSAGTTYYFRVFAESKNGPSHGRTLIFTTKAVVVPGCQANCGGTGGGGGGSGENNVVKQARSEPPPAPVVTLQGASAAVAATGSFTVKASCPTGVTSCSGTVTVQTASAVIARAGIATTKHKATILTLATGSFTLSAGQTKVLTLRLSAKGRALLARLHVVRVRVTVAAHDPSGGNHTSVVVITLRPAKATHRKHHG